MGRYAAQLPYVDFPSLGEGLTPLIELPSLAQTLGIERLWAKNEGQNPTGSHKDRMSALVVARAASVGRTTVTAASSGNAGASLAAYAGAAGLRCVIVSTPKISSGWARAIELAGAELVFTDTSLERWQYLQQKVKDEGWYPATNYLDPPVGSSPFGVQGYKTIGYEIVEQCGDTPPTMVLVPTARGDLLWGIWQGLSELARDGLLDPPGLVAVEPIPRLSRVLAGEDYRRPFSGDPHAMTSIGGATATYQSVVALSESKGCAIEVSTQEAEEAQQELARYGLYVELSSAASLAGLQTLVKRGKAEISERVLLVITSHGYKEQAG
jgi:threonine synthase